MKQLLFILTVLAITSCSSYNRIRYVRAGNERPSEQKIIDKENLSSQDVLPDIYSEMPASPEANGIQESGTTDKTEPIPTENNRSQPSVIKPQDEPLSDSPDKEVILDQAIRTEKQADASFYLFLAGLISIIAPYIGIVPFIIGLFLFQQARSSRYITQYGENRLRLARNVLVADTVILLLWLLFIVLLVLAF